MAKQKKDTPAAACTLAAQAKTLQQSSKLRASKESASATPKAFKKPAAKAKMIIKNQNQPAKAK